MDRLDFEENNIKGVALAKIMAAIHSNEKALTTLDWINLKMAHWDTDEACQELAHLLAKSKTLFECDTTQEQERIVRVEQNLCENSE